LFIGGFTGFKFFYSNSNKPHTYLKTKATDYPRGFAEKIYSDQAACNALREDRK
jgi:hypothetical protein